MNTAELFQRMHAIRDRKHWQPLHSPGNLAMTASVEMLPCGEPGINPERAIPTKPADNQRRCSNE